ncbi:hypothetical protein ACTJKZ_21145 [Pantoea sp. 22096]|uniref:hypothetical protein n=1 Tax=Pantoea sp. 22096 TaxID=3453873 RepID=UPI003F84535D
MPDDIPGKTVCPSETVRNGGAKKAVYLVAKRLHFLLKRDGEQKNDAEWFKKASLSA